MESQEHTEAFLVAPPSDPVARQPSVSFRYNLQRRLGLVISDMLDTFRLAAAAGDTYDLLGDRLGTEGDRGAPHRAVVTAWHAAVQAVASGPVVLGDKEAHDKDIYYIYNEGHVLDLGLYRGMVPAVAIASSSSRRTRASSPRRRARTPTPPSGAAPTRSATPRSGSCA